MNFQEYRPKRTISDHRSLKFYQPNRKKSFTHDSINIQYICTVLYILYIDTIMRKASFLRLVDKI